MIKRTVCGVLLLCSSLFSMEVQNTSNEKNEISLSLNNLMHEVLKRNGDIIKEYLQLDISRNQIEYERGIYDPTITSSFIRQSTNVPNSTENELVRYQETYQDKVNFFDVGINGLMATGATWALSYSNNKKKSSLIDQYKDYDKEYETSAKFEIEQPILKGVGKTITEAKIKLAQFEDDIKNNAYKQKLMELQGLTIQVYWRLYGAQKIYKSWDKSIKLAKKSLEDLELRVKNGKVAKTELIEAKSALNIRMSEYENAKNKFNEAQNQVLTLLNLPYNQNNNFVFEIIDNPDKEVEKLLNSQKYIELALEKWPEYQNAKKNVEKESLQKKYSKNQTLPQFNLIGSLERTSLQSDYSDSIDNSVDPEFTNWTLGVKFSMPLFNQQAQSSLNISRVKYQQSKIELSNMQNNLINSIMTKIDNVESSKKQYHLYKEGLEKQEYLLEVENDKLMLGKSSARDMFQKEEDYMNYQRKFLNSIVNWKTSQALLEITAGNLLKKYNIKVENLGNQSNINNKNIFEILGNNK